MLNVRVPAGRSAGTHPEQFGKTDNGIQGRTQLLVQVGAESALVRRKRLGSIGHGRWFIHDWHLALPKKQVAFKPGTKLSVPAPFPSVTRTVHRRRGSEVSSA